MGTPDDNENELDELDELQDLEVEEADADSLTGGPNRRPFAPRNPGLSPNLGS